MTAAGPWRQASDNPPYSMSSFPLQTTSGAAGKSHRWNLWALGILLLVGFAMPVYFPDDGSGDAKSEWIVPNIKLLEPEGFPGVEKVPTGVKLLCLWPAIAGVALLVIGASLRGIARAIAVLVTGVLPFLVPLLAMARLPKGVIPKHILRLISSYHIEGPIWIWVLALLCLWSGVRARSRSNDSKLAAITGTAGGGLCLLGLILPIVPKLARDDLGAIPLMVPFKLVGAMHGAPHDSAVWLKWGLLACLLCMIVAAILALVNSTNRRNAKCLSRISFGLITVGLTSLVIGLLVMPYSGEAEIQQKTALFFLFIIIKALLYLGTLVLVVPAGTVDLIVASSEAIPALCWRGQGDSRTLGEPAHRE